MAHNVSSWLAQIDALLASWAAIVKRAKYVTLEDIPEGEVAEAATRILSCIERLSPPGGSYRRSAGEVQEKFEPSDGSRLNQLGGVLKALREDLAAGWLATFEELIHADLFGDLLEQARYLNEQGFKDAAAVIAGSVLEQHLRSLCIKNSILVLGQNGKPKKADLINAELATATAISKADQKSVTAWLALRNDAAHGNYGAYTSDQASLLVAAVRDFVTRNPA